MFTLQKSPDRDFVILNITDPQVDYEVWGEGLTAENTIRLTLDKILPRVKPDLITMSGDFSDEYTSDLYTYIIDYFDSFGIPWAPVMGNHDQEDGADPWAIADMLKERKNCLFEAGPENLGCGHYVIGIEESGRLVSALIMMDSHRRKYITDENGNEKRVMVEFTPEQLEWYREQVENLRSLGCEDTTLIFHIPIYEFKEAYTAAIKADADLEDLLPWDTEGADIWNEGYEDSFGINYEKTACHPKEIGFFDLICDLGSTKNVICGHDHGNNASINYRGVRLTYATNIGCGGYFIPKQNGATVITVGGDGVKGIHHEYVDIRDMWYNNYNR